MDLARFVESSLKRAGCLTECVETDVVVAILPSQVAVSLQVPEEVRLRVRGVPASGELHAGVGSTLLAQICTLSSGTTRRFRAVPATPVPRRERVLKDVQRALTFQNAVGRLESIEEESLMYLAFDFRFEALSEERYEGLLSVAVDREAGWSPDLARLLLAGAGAANGAWTEPPPPEEPGEVGAGYRRAQRLAMALAREASRGFIDRMTRRLRRDTRRAEEYYGALGVEIERRRSRGRETPEMLRAKVQAVETEKGRRLHDLERRYAVTLRLEPLCLLSMRMAGLSLKAKLLRRKNERIIRLGWNPLTREFDRWLCGGCGGPAGIPSVCDQMHLLCGPCASPCASCGHRACPACTRRCGCGANPAGTRHGSPAPDPPGWGDRT